MYSLGTSDATTQPSDTVAEDSEMISGEACRVADNSSGYKMRRAVGGIRMTRDLQMGTLNARRP